MIGRTERREWAAAGIHDPGLQLGFHQARELNARHGKTYYLAARMLPPAKRPYVHGLYGFARYADDIVDDLDATITDAERSRQFEAWRDAFLQALAAADSRDQLVAAVTHTIGRWQIPIRYFADFLTAMAMDLTVTEYQTYADLEAYMWGSAAVIGLQMLPILGYRSQDEELARRTAADLGIAFQLTNFIRDVAEDLSRGRIYLPQESLQAAGVDRDRLVRASRRGLVDPPIRRLVQGEVERARRLYRAAEPGIELLDPSSRPCMRIAFRLYSEILDQVENADYNVFARRATVPLRRRARVAGAELFRARAVRWRRLSPADASGSVA